MVYYPKHQKTSCIIGIANGGSSRFDVLTCFLCGWVLTNRKKQRMRNPIWPSFLDMCGSLGWGVEEAMDDVVSYSMSFNESVVFW